MPRTEDGEYELVLGNRQLLSIFFIVVVLLGVGFTLGYMLGRGSVTATTAAAETPDPKGSEAALPPPAGSAVPPASAPPAPTNDDLKPSPVDDARPVPAAKTAAENRAATPPPDKAKAAPTATAAVASSSKYKTGAPPRGAVFIQVAAVPAADAEAEAEGLAAKGYPIWVAPNERTADLFSVLVGPFTDRAELAKAKTGLEQLGFRKAFRKEIK